MKKYLFTLIAVSLMTGASCQKKIDIEKEKEAIKAVIEEETDAFVDQDIERVEATWKQDLKSRKIFFNEGKYVEVKGKEELREYEEFNLHGEWREEPGNLGDRDIKFTNYEINVYGSTAIVYFDFEDQKRIIHLVKEEGKWKQDLMVILGNVKEISLEEAISKMEYGLFDPMCSSPRFTLGVLLIS